MKQYLLKLIDGASLTQEETHSIMLNIIDGKYNDQQIAALLMAIQARFLACARDCWRPVST